MNIFFEIGQVKVAIKEAFGSDELCPEAKAIGSLGVDLLSELKEKEKWSDAYKAIGMHIILSGTLVFALARQQKNQSISSSYNLSLPKIYELYGTNKKHKDCESNDLDNCDDCRVGIIKDLGAKIMKHRLDFDAEILKLNFPLLKVQINGIQAALQGISYEDFLKRKNEALAFKSSSQPFYTNSNFFSPQASNGRNSDSDHSTNTEMKLLFNEDSSKYGNLSH